MLSRKWWLWAVLGTTVVLGWLGFRLAPRTYDLGDVSVCFAGFGGVRTVTITNQSGGLLLVPNEPGWYIHKDDPAVEYADRLALMRITDFSLLPPGGALVTAWQGNLPRFADLPSWRAMDEVRTFARLNKVGVLLLPTTKL